MLVTHCLSFYKAVSCRLWQLTFDRLTSDQMPMLQCEGQGISVLQGLLSSGLGICWQSAACRARCSSSPTLWMHRVVLLIVPASPQDVEQPCHSPTHHLRERRQDSEKEPAPDKNTYPHFWPLSGAEMRTPESGAVAVLCERRKLTFIMKL